MTVGHALLVFLVAVLAGGVVYFVSSFVEFLKAYRQGLALAAFGLVILFGLLFPLLNVTF